MESSAIAKIVTWPMSCPLNQGSSCTCRTDWRKGILHKGMPLLPVLHRASASSLLFSRSLPLASTLPSLLRRRAVFLAMSTAANPQAPTHSLVLPTQPDEPVQIVAAPGVTDSQFRSAIDSSLFKQWLKNLQSETGVLANGAASLRQVLIQGVDMFGNRLGFLKFKADIFDKETGQKVEEETGIQLNLEDMIDLTAFLDSSTGNRVFPSPGGCDEDLSIFLFRGRVDKEKIEQLQGKETGLREHGELIRVRVVPYEKLWHSTADAKVLVAIALYEMAKKEGFLPPVTSS